MTYISKFISYDEATRTSTGIPNVPTDKEIAAMQLVAQKVFDKVREHFGYPIKVNSFFRSESVNKAVGGASNSAHKYGEAIDITGKFIGISDAAIFNYIKNNLPFTKLIWEFGNDAEPDWVHVQFNGEDSKICLRAVKENGKTKYVTI